MPQTKQAEKALRQTKKRTVRNTKVKGDLKTLRKKAGRALTDSELIQKTIKQIDKAVQKGLLKKNTAARYKSRLMKASNKAKASK